MNVNKYFLDGKFIGDGSLAVFAGPCSLESPELGLRVAKFMKRLCEERNLLYVFKASFDKANRTSIHAYRGPGIEKGLEQLAEIKSSANVPIITDIHESWQAAPVGEVADVLQIPAFLCRQTDLLVAAAKTGKTVNIKKGQFLSGEAMGFAVEKVRQSGNDKVMLTERGSMFGYQDLVVDYRNIPVMQSFGVPVVLDVTHSLQQPNQASGVTGGKPELIGLIAKAGIAAGADGIFMETHPDPAHALSDGANMLPLDKVESLLSQLLRIKQAL